MINILKEHRKTAPKEGYSYAEAKKKNLFRRQASTKNVPILSSDLFKDFYEHARTMQKGGPEFISSKKWLNIWWPPDELAFIRAVTENKIEDFYEDAKHILFEIFEEKGIKNYESVISESINLNKVLIKLPNQTKDLQINLNYNIWDVYNETLMGRKKLLKKGNFECLIDRTTETWNSWEDWCEKVVWWSNKKGAYLYNSLPSDQVEMDISKVIKYEEIKNEPFGNDIRYQ